MNLGHSEIYDWKSNMHYQYYYFRTPEAQSANLPTMTVKATGEYVYTGSKRNSSIDMMQLAKRYNNVCPVPDTLNCTDPDASGNPRYALRTHVCDDICDCPDCSDETEEACANNTSTTQPPSTTTTTTTTKSTTTTTPTTTTPTTTTPTTTKKTTTTASTTTPTMTVTTTAHSTTTSGQFCSQLNPLPITWSGKKVKAKYYGPDAVTARITIPKQNEKN